MRRPQLYDSTANRPRDAHQVQCPSELSFRVLREREPNQGDQHVGPGVAGTHSHFPEAANLRDKLDTPVRGALPRLPGRQVSAGRCEPQRAPSRPRKHKETADQGVVGIEGCHRGRGELTEVGQ
eukprot:14426209-Alexandrium_andersonii.AAC.1